MIIIGRDFTLDGTNSGNTDSTIYNSKIIYPANGLSIFYDKSSNILTIKQSTVSIAGNLGANNSKIVSTNYIGSQIFFTF